MVLYFLLYKMYYYLKEPTLSKCANFAPLIFCILDKEVNLFVIFRTKNRNWWNNNYLISSPSLIHWKFGKQTWKQDFGEFTTHMLTASFHAEQGVRTRNRNRKGRIKRSGRKAWLKITIFAIHSPFLLPSFFRREKKSQNNDQSLDFKSYLSAWSN